MLIAVVATMFATTQPAATQARRAPVSAKTMRTYQPLFTKVDTNRDGHVTRAEADAYIGKRRISRVIRERVWRQFDANRNGTVSLAEFARQAVKYDSQMGVK